MVPDQSLPDALPAEPLGTAKSWLAEAMRRGDEPNPNAMVLATCDARGHPSARIVLCKDIDAESGTLRFFTNYQSRKGRELQANPNAALVMHWDHLYRQVRVEGIVQKVSCGGERQLLRRPRHATASSAPMPARRASRSGPARRCARSWTQSSRDFRAMSWCRGRRTGAAMCCGRTPWNSGWKAWRGCMTGHAGRER